MTNLYIDVETIPTQNEQIMKDIRLSIKPPANITKEETKKKWMEEKKPLEVDKAYRKTALNGTLGEIICIGYAINDESVCISGRKVGESEADIIRELFNTLGGIKGEVQIIGHCVADFDLKFIYHRAVINNVKPPKWFPIKDVKAWSKGIFDTKEQWVGKSSASGSLDAICKAMGIEGKGDIDGSKVWDYIKAGKYEEVFKYCGEDVERVRQLYYRMNFIS